MRKNIVVLVAALLFALTTAEVVIRLAAGYPVSFERLPEEYQPERVAEKAKTYMESVAMTPDVQTSWYSLEPPLTIYPDVSEEDKRMFYSFSNDVYEAPGGVVPTDADLYKLWNVYYLQQQLCDKTEPTMFDFFPGNQAYYFVPSAQITQPVYRFMPNSKTPSGDTGMDPFGWRGNPVSLNKADSTIRIAFIGASTTQQNLRFKYAASDYVIYWLNLWAQENYLPVKFDGINTGREGISITDIAAIVRYELLPVAPDLFVFYEGNNDFLSPWDLVKMPPGHHVNRTPLMYKLYMHVALVRRLLNLAGWKLKEPNKPDYMLNLPAFQGIDDVPGLPGKLPTVISSLDSIRKDAQSIDAELIISSFVFVVEDGMLLDPVKNAFVYGWWNEMWWPLKYKDVRLMADYQNQAFETYAHKYNLPFFDVDKEMPPDPDLFYDGIHIHEETVPLRAWVTFRQLLPVIKEKLNNGQLPKPPPVHNDSHPEFMPTPSKKVKLQCDCLPRQNDGDPYCLNHFGKGYQHSHIQ